jgi:single-strand DNA-binding protein
MLNSFLGIGRIGQDAEITVTRNGDPMARFSIAIDRIQRKGNTAEPDWIRCHLFGDRARLLGPYLSKGVMVGVSGRLESYRTSGEKPRQVLRVDVSEVNFLNRPVREVEAQETVAQETEAKPAEEAVLAAV